MTTYEQELNTIAFTFEIIYWIFLLLKSVVLAVLADDLPFFSLITFPFEIMGELFHCQKYFIQLKITHNSKSNQRTDGMQVLMKEFYDFANIIFLVSISIHCWLPALGNVEHKLKNQFVYFAISHTIFDMNNS